MSSLIPCEDAGWLLQLEYEDRRGAAWCAVLYEWMSSPDTIGDGLVANWFLFRSAWVAEATLLLTLGRRSRCVSRGSTNRGRRIATLENPHVFTRASSLVRVVRLTVETEAHVGPVRRGHLRSPTAYRNVLSTIRKHCNPVRLNLSMVLEAAPEVQVALDALTESGRLERSGTLGDALHRAWMLGLDWSRSAERAVAERCSSTKDDLSWFADILKRKAT